MPLFKCIEDVAWGVTFFLKFIYFLSQQWSNNQSLIEAGQYVTKSWKLHDSLNPLHPRDEPLLLFLEAVAVEVKTLER